MKKIFTLAAAVLASFSLWAADPTSTLDVAEAAGTNEYVSANLDANTPKSLTYCGYNSSGSGSYTGFLEGTSRWKLSSSRTISFKVQNCDSVALQCQFTKDATTSVKYAIGSDEAVEFITNGSDKKVERTGGFKTETAGEITFTISVNNDLLLGNIYFFPASATPSTDPVESAEISGADACLVGNSVTLTCTAAKATTYQWSMNGTEIEGANAKKYTFSPTEAGEYSFTCAASNEYTTTPVVADAHVVTVMDPANAYGELIKATLLGGTSATMTGVIGGTFDTNLGSGKFKLDKGKYFGITLAAGSFKEGDTVVITMTTAGSNYPCLFADKEKTNCLYLAEATSSDLEYKIVLPAAADGLSSLYLARDDDDATYKWNPVLSSMAVVRPMAAKNVIESLTGVAVDDVAISDLAALLANHEITLADSYVNAPVVKFTKHVVTTYIDDSQAEKDVVVEVTAEEVEGAWEAAATIGGVAYTIKAAKENSVVVTYMDGENKLGEENVAIGGHPADFAQYQNKSLASFVGWYNNADLADEHIVADMSSEVISVATTYYAKFENAYATSYNFEKAVMENGKAYDFLSQLGAQHYATNITGSLDSLDNSKKDSLRNYAYLGLKVKQSGALLNFRVAAGQTIKVKFGNIAKTPTVSINGGDYAEMEITEHVYEHTAATEELISIKTMDGNAVVFQQIAIGEELAAPELYTINYAETENGAVSGWKMGIPGEEVKVYYEVAEGYKTYSLTYNGVALHDDGVGYVTFTMPSEAVTVAAEFLQEFPTAIDNTNAETKAAKVIRNGQLIIVRDGVEFNAQGAIVK